MESFGHNLETPRRISVLTPQLIVVSDSKRHFCSSCLFLDCGSDCYSTISSDAVSNAVPRCGDRSVGQQPTELFGVNTRPQLAMNSRVKVSPRRSSSINICLLYRARPLVNVRLPHTPLERAFNHPCPFNLFPYMVSHHLFSLSSLSAHLKLLRRRHGVAKSTPRNLEPLSTSNQESSAKRLLKFSISRVVKNLVGASLNLNQPLGQPAPTKIAGWQILRNARRVTKQFKSALSAANRMKAKQLKRIHGRSAAPLLALRQNHEAQSNMYKTIPRERNRVKPQRHQMLVEVEQPKRDQNGRVIRKSRLQAVLCAFNQSVSQSVSL